MSAGGRVAVAMSGGVDSSTAAAILKAQGYDLVGFSMQLWDQRQNPANPDVPSRCCSLDDLHDARSVAARLGFPYYVVNFQDEFREKVVRSFIEAYRGGYTPSPCVLCNSRMKFDHLLKMAAEVEAAHIATGHYARVELDRETGRYLLLRARDLRKDQSYFLFELSQAQLSQAMFPLGCLTKAEVREIARRYGLAVAAKPESQEICFVPDGDYAAFIERNYRGFTGPDDGSHAALEPGEVVDRDGRVLGTHPGIHHYTVGQRRGLGIARPEPLYVVDLDPGTRRVVVGYRSDAESRSCRVERLNWIAFASLEGPLRVHARIRSRHREAPAKVTPIEDGSLQVLFDSPQAGVAPGQACVFYDGERVLGGGWIARNG